MFSGLGGQNQDGAGEKCHGAKALYVYLLTYNILYKNAYWGCKMMYSPILFIIGWKISTLPPGSTPLDSSHVPLTHKNKETTH